MNKKNLLILLVFIGSVFFFFNPYFLKGSLPIPSDTIIGLYHPYRDLYAKDYPNGIPFKNFLITDPVRQQYPWKDLAITLEKQVSLPLWNPYNLSGTPLLANFQSSVFYPLNIFLFILPFSQGWSVLIILQLILGGVFMYLYLSNLKLHKWANLLGVLSFVFSGFFVAWMEWNTIVQTGLWLPLILLSIDKLFSQRSINLKNKSALWVLVFIFSLISAFFAGHLQVFTYLYVVSLTYFLIRIGSSKNKIRSILLFTVFNLIFLAVTVIQWIPTLQFILLSARGVDQLDWQKTGWFISWQNLIQFIAPDFFGNPTTLNYWGVWNYAEFIGYIGIVPLIMAFFAAMFRRDKNTLFFTLVTGFALVFSLPTIFAKIPFQLQIPFLSTSQPTRLLFIVDFSLSVLAAFGLDLFLKSEKKMRYVIAIFVSLVVFLWIVVLFGSKLITHLDAENLVVAKQNLIFPTIVFTLASFFILLHGFVKNKKISQLLILLLIVLTFADLYRFANKFTPFTNSSYLFPTTKTIDFLKSATKTDQSRIMSTDSRILPPNFSTIYALQSIEGYDPLYLLRYGEFIAASEREKPDISPPFGFNRIITPHNINSKLIDLLGVKYVLSLDEINNPKFEKVFEEGQTKVYKNTLALPRTFFVKKTLFVKNKNTAIRALFVSSIDLKNTAIVEKEDSGKDTWSEGKAIIQAYSPNKVIIQTDNVEQGFLVLTDVYYPAWKVKINGVETEIYKTDFAFRGIVVPPGKHTILFYTSLF